MVEEAKELTQEDVFSNDLDPLEAIRELRKEEGASEEVLEAIVSDETPEVILDPDEEKSKADEEELEALKPEAETEEDSKASAAPEEKSDDDAAQPLATSEEDEDENEDENAEKPTGKTPETYKFRANGQDFEFSQEEVLAQFETVFGQSMDYTQKMQKIAPYRKMISALEEQGISQEQLNVAIDAIKGDKGAIQQILKAHKIDSDDLDPDEDDTPYAANDYGKNTSQLDIEAITSKIEKDEEYAITVDVIDKQWDQDSRKAIAENPQMIEGLHNDIKNGIYDKVAPVAMKLKVLDGNTKSDIEYYMIAGQQLQQQENGQTVDKLNAPAQEAGSKFEEASSEAKTKRAASSTRTRADRKGVIDYLDDDDEAYNAWYKKLQASQ